MAQMDYNIEKVIEFIETAKHLIKSGVKEDVIRHNFTSYLSAIFEKQPNWVREHVLGGESKVEKDSGVGFIDNLIGLTVIEYEKDLSVKSNFDTGYEQVREYCLGKIREGHPVDKIIGVLSDTINWYVYKVSDFQHEGNASEIKLEQITLESIDHYVADKTMDSAEGLIEFLQTYLGRIGTRPINAYSIANDFGFESPYSNEFIKDIDKIVEDAISQNPKYASVITKLWSRVITDKEAEEGFDRDTYRDELYMVTLAKLICANIIEKKGLLSSDDEIYEILQGEYFERKGFTNIVEYDYFGWLNSEPYLNDLLPVAKKIQRNLRAYDFGRNLNEDLFGQMFAQLSNRTQRILLGQEWTPNWLASEMAGNMIDNLPDDELPHLVDMCCGSGVMVVESLKHSKNKIQEKIPEESSRDRIRALTASITGFDIDPLAVILSKISWIIEANDWIEEIEGEKITIPIYHADSLFAISPLNDLIDESNDFLLELDQYKVNLPQFLLTPKYEGIFDYIIDKGYQISLQDELLSEESSNSMCSKIVDQAQQKFGFAFNEDEYDRVLTFITSFVNIVNELHVEGKNGIWSFILKNSYRPGLLTGQFNGLISNPPWLSLSKLKDNPYRSFLREKANEFNVKPEGASFLHVELATIFLLQGISKYLKNGAHVACIVPGTVLNGKHHNAFRNEKYNSIQEPVNFKLKEIWKVGKHTFKNEAIVLLGEKESSTEESVIDDGYEVLNGKYVSRSNVEEINFYKNKLGSLTAWNEEKVVNKDEVQNVAPFKQGADIMPRTFYVYDISETNDGLFKVKSIDIQSDLSFIISDLKKHKDFKIQTCHVQEDVVFNVYTSKLLTPFTLAESIRAVLPIKKDDQNKFQLIPEQELNIRDDDLGYIMRKVEDRVEGYQTNWDRLNEHNKLVNQSSFSSEGYMVVVGTGGGIVCGAYESMANINAEKCIIDQTLNWVHVTTEEEALFLTGLFNCKAINDAIKVFQPRGQQGERHIHSLPYKVTNEYDPSNELHQQIVSNTRELINQFKELVANDMVVREHTFPQKSTLPRRRKYIRDKVEDLPGYAEYENKCREFYGLS